MKVPLSVLLLSISFLLTCLPSHGQEQNERAEAEVFNVSINTQTIMNEVDPYYRSVTVDTTNNRQFFDVNWSNPNIMAYMKALGPMYVRVGGSGEGQDHLQFDGTPCENQYSCIDEELFDQVYNLIVKNGGNRMVWGLPYQKLPNNSWDPTASEGLMAYASSKGYTIWGFELGNEDDNQCNNYPDLYAQDFGRLKAIAATYWKDPATAPKIYGPDYQGGADWGPQQFFKQCIAQGIDMSGITSHEYYGMNNASYIEGSRLDSNWHTALNWTSTLTQYYGPTGKKPQMWAGEIGPSIGGSGNCSDYYHRFNIFADGFWYLDSLASHALLGYQVFCRQDFYGIDYALLNCAHLYPMPDYYLALTWNLVVGTKALNATRPVTKPSASVRTYAHCAKQYSGGLVVMIINLFGYDVDCQLQLTEGSQVGSSREDYVFTARDPNGTYPDGIYGQWASLNGKFINVTSSGELPAITPSTKTTGSLDIISMPPYSYGYFVYPKANLAACKTTTQTTSTMPAGEKTPVLPVIMEEVVQGQ